MIKLQIIGNLGADCIQKEINGKTVINFNVAHSEKYKDAQGNPKERTTWVNCAYWTDRTAVAQYLTKGRTVYAEGSPEAEAYTNKDGQPASTLRMRVQTVQLLGGNTELQGNTGNNYNQGNVTNAGSSTAPVVKSQPALQNAPVEDDLPF
ncbi:MAG: single-stranded DNA-binding protein [Ferruginibacter sp.]|nr:single-stranded DNA-binding protein [Ferruginibacter sp.]